MVLISCLDSVEGAKGLGVLFSMGEFRMVNNGKSFGLYLKAKSIDPSQIELGIKGILRVQYKLSSVNRICGLMLINTNVFPCTQISMLQ